MQLRRSDRTRRSTAILDYVYLQEADFDIGDEADPTSFKEAMESLNADKWRKAKLNELESMKNNQLKEYCPKNKEDEDEMRNKQYASLVGSIMYAKVCTMPHLALCISKMGRFQSNPGMQHWIAGKKILRYMHKTKAYMLICNARGYADANLRKAEDDYISTSGFLFKIAGAAVAWKSAKQYGVSSSTMFSEYIACYEATSHAVWLRNFIKDIKVGDSISRPILIYNDNTTIVFHCMNNKMSSGPQHIDKKYLTVKEEVADKLVIFDHIRTQDVIADPFTKFLPSEAFPRHVESMGLFPNFDAAI
ncbi:hypothetical protein L3X38_010010 [Prunus dulcis]|uniref:Transposable element protein n=1 Tax=Prunus dulcis TaxID=3755 RepID=A0AAD4WEP2_PRUDU|nr:hypothetical protein L3X38_010010 [Prunus dulcis]